MGRCSFRKFSCAVLSAACAVCADVTAASAAFRVDASVVAEIHAWPAAMPARSAVAIASKTVAFANTVSGGPRQNFHHGGAGGSCEFSALAALLGACRGSAAASERLGARSSLFI